MISLFQAGNLRLFNPRLPREIPLAHSPLFAQLCDGDGKANLRTSLLQMSHKLGIPLSLFVDVLAESLHHATSWLPHYAALRLVQYPSPSPFATSS